MEHSLTQDLWKQFGAAIDTLENAIELCPVEHWNTESKFWYIAYHSLFFLDYYLTMEPGKFLPPHPFTFSEFEDVMPDKVYTKSELITYLKTCRNKCGRLIAGLTPAKFTDRWTNISGSMNYSIFEILLYNMRHVQHHAAQLNLLLRQGINNAPEWVSRTNDDV